MSILLALENQAFTGLMVRDARHGRAPHHEDLRPHPEEHREAMRLEG
jgi:hypothetical protein